MFYWGWVRAGTKIQIGKKQKFIIKTKICWKEFFFYHYRPSWKNKFESLTFVHLFFILHKFLYGKRRVVRSLDEGKKHFSKNFFVFFCFNFHQDWRIDLQVFIEDFENKDIFLGVAETEQLSYRNLLKFLSLLDSLFGQWRDSIIQGNSVF